MTVERMLKNDRKRIDCVGLSINRKELEYMVYITTHRYNIKYAYIKYGDIISKTLGLTDDELDTLDTAIEEHDKSKFSISEFDAYRMHFYPIKEEEGIDDTIPFNKAWEHHYSHNKHHWEYYHTIYGCIDMPKVYIAEMVLDWIAMSMNNNTTSKAYTYYNDNKNKIKLSKATRPLVEKVLLAVREYDVHLGDV